MKYSSAANKCRSTISSCELVHRQGTEEFNRRRSPVRSPYVYVLRYTKYIPQAKLLWARKFAKKNSFVPHSFAVYEVKQRYILNELRSKGYCARQGGMDHYMFEGGGGGGGGQFF